MNKIGIWDTFVAERPSAAGQIRQRDAGAGADKPKLSKKAAAKATAAAEEAAAPAPVEEPAAEAVVEAPPEPEAVEPEVG